MAYTNYQASLTKERLEDLRKERKLSFKQLAQLLEEQGVHVSHTNLKNYEINDPLHPLYHRTKIMSLEYFVVLADVYDVSVDYLLGRSNSRKAEYQNISEELCLDDGVIEMLKNVIAEDRRAEQKEGAHPFLESRIHLLNEIFLDNSFVEALGLLCEASASLQRHVVFESAEALARDKVEAISSESSEHSQPKNLENEIVDNENLEPENVVPKNISPRNIAQESVSEKIRQAEQLLNQHGLTPVNNKIIHDLFVSRALSLVDNLFSGLSEKMLDKELERRRRLVLLPKIFEDVRNQKVEKSKVEAGITSKKNDIDETDVSM